MNKIEEMVKNSAKRAETARKEYRIHGTDIFIKDPLPADINMNKVIRQIEYITPLNLFKNIDVIYIGQFDEFEERSINAFYADGALYITNHQSDYNDMVDDIIHEMAHSVEELYQGEIYSDGVLEEEFLSKRNILRRVLKSMKYETDNYDFTELTYSKKLDYFFLREVGYAKLINLTRGLFASPYSATSLREYWATGFEEYLLGDRIFLERTSPKLYNKINALINLEGKQ